MDGSPTIVGDQDQVAIISVVMPLDASDSSSDAAGIISGNMTDLSAIKNDVSLAQQVANGQVAVVQAQTADSDEGTPQYITVTGNCLMLIFNVASVTCTMSFKSNAL